MASPSSLSGLGSRVWLCLLPCCFGLACFTDARLADYDPSTGTDSQDDTSASTAGSGIGSDGSDDDSDLVDIAAGDGRSCAIFSDGEARCWHGFAAWKLGYQSLGETIKGDDERPIDGGGLELKVRIQKLASGDYDMACALDAEGQVYCWGEREQLGYPEHTSPLGRDEAPDAAGPVDFGEDSPVVDLGVGHDHACVQFAAGTVKCWGRDWYGALGFPANEDMGDDEAPAECERVALGGDVKHLYVGYEHNCVQLDHGEVRCWGATATWGVPTNERPTKVERPIDLPPIQLGAQVQKLALGRGFSCALLAEGHVRCWGRAGPWLGQPQHKGDIGVEQHPAALPVLALAGEVVDIWASGSAAFALLDDGSVRVWGRHALGIVDIDEIGSDQPLSDAPKLELGGRPSKIVGGEKHACALLDDASMRCWGSPPAALGYGDGIEVGVEVALDQQGPIRLR